MALWGLLRLAPPQKKKKESKSGVRSVYSFCQPLGLLDVLRLPGARLGRLAAAAMDRLCDDLLKCLMDAAGDDGETLLALRRTDTRWWALVDARLEEVYVPPMRRALDCMGISVASRTRVRTWALRTLPGLSSPQRSRSAYRCARVVRHLGECARCQRAVHHVDACARRTWVHDGWSTALSAGPWVVACYLFALAVTSTARGRSGAQ